MSGIFSYIWRWLVAFISGRLDELQTDAKITQDESDIKAKSAEATAIVEDLNKQGLLKTQLATQAAEIEKTVVEDTKNVEAATAKTEADLKALADVKPEEHVKAADLAAKLKDL